MSRVKVDSEIPRRFNKICYNCLLMVGIFAVAYSICLGLVIWLTDQEIIPKISEKRYEILWALVLAPIFFMIYLVIYYFEKDEM